MLDNYASRSRRYHGGKILFPSSNDGVQLGDRLSDVHNRLSKRERVHFLDTLRHDGEGEGGLKREKMVDTALTSDLLILVNHKRADKYIVLSDDDDMLPGVIAADHMGADVKMLRRQERRSRYMAHVDELVDVY